MANVRRSIQSASSSKLDFSTRTESTASDTSSSGEMSPPKEAQKSPHQRRRRTSTGRSSGRDRLMNLIATEMSSTLPEEKDNFAVTALITSQQETPATLSAEDIFYAQMNGEMLDASNRTDTSDIEVPVKHLEEDDDANSFDDCSFGDLTLPDNVRATSLSSRRSSGMESKASSKGKNSQGSRSKRTSRSKSSGSSGNNQAEILSIGEIQEYVKKSTPAGVRTTMPKEALSQISRASSQDEPEPSQVSTDQEDSEDEDDSSVMSDITEFTSYLQDCTESMDNEESLGLEGENWDEEICPGLDVRSIKTRDKSEGSRDCDLKSGHSSGLVSLRTVPSGEVVATKVGGVSFSYVEVRHYERILEINPAVSHGPAIGIGWRFKRGGKIAVEDWEIQRGGKLRSTRELILPRQARESILNGLGYDQKQIAEALRIIRKAKDRRKVTVQNMGAGTQAMEETVEAASRKIKGMLSFGRKKGL